MKDLPAIAEKKWCYWLPYIPNSPRDDGHYYVGIVLAGEAGYYLTDWDYGTDRELAAATVDKMNATKLQLSSEDVDRIVCSSMFLPGGAR